MGRVWAPYVSSICPEVSQLFQTHFRDVSKGVLVGRGRVRRHGCAQSLVNDCETRRRDINEMETVLDVPADPARRSWRSGFPAGFLGSYHQGVRDYTYRGVSCLKSPVDLSLYLKLLFELSPGTLIEIGAHHGGSALFFADQCRAMGLATRIISVDARDRRQVHDPRVEFIRADARDLSTSPVADLGAFARPLLVIEDSAHTPPVSASVLEFFHTRMAAEDVIVVEDGILTELGLSEQFHGGPAPAIARFLKRHPGDYRLMTEYMDFFGTNVTYSPNGWLQRL